jgi:hypothetical protein
MMILLKLRENIIPIKLFQRTIKVRIILLIFLSGIIIPNFLFAQITQQGPKLVGIGAVGSPVYQGQSVAISSDGNTAIEGGYFDNNNVGAVWVFTRSSGVWNQKDQKLVGSGAAGICNQGISVAISSDGSTAVVGGPVDNINTGAAWVFTRNNGVWSQQGSKIVGTGAVGSAFQGQSVAISSDGNTAIVGGYQDNGGKGAAWIFTRSDTVWTQQDTKLVGTGFIGSAYEGSSVAISSDGNTAVVGGNYDNNSIGAVWVFTRTNGIWTQQGLKLVGTGVVGKFGSQGSSVSISSDGNTIIEGGPGDGVSNLGAAWIFTRSSGVWTQQGSSLVATGSVGSSYQGQSVAISSDGNIAIIGAHYNNSDGGGISAFTRSGGVWTQQGQEILGSGSVGASAQGRSVAISSEGTALIGGPNDNNLAGAVWVFVYKVTGIAPNFGEVPEAFNLSQNYPNPFNPGTTISYQLKLSGHVTLKVYDLLGNEVATLVNEEKPAGIYSVVFDAGKLSSGIYLYKLQAGNFVETKKMTLLK